MTDRSPIRIGSRTVGVGHAPLLLPDIDMFFNADMDMAKEMTRAVRDAGLTTIKAAVLHDPSIALDAGAQETFLNKQGQPVSVDYRKLIEKKAMSLDAHRSLFDFIHESGLELVLSVYDLKGLELAVSSGAVAIKMPSSNITHQPLIAAAAASALPLILDTGKSTIEEIARALEWAAPARARGLIVEHSPDAPPAPVDRQELMMIPRLSDTFDLHAGLSDHHRGTEMMLAATALGAVVLEKGLTVDNPDADQDVFHAMRLSDLAPLKRQVEMIQAALGRGQRAYPADRPVPQARMGLVAATDLPSGSIVELGAVDFAFPPMGIGAEHWSMVEGWRLRRAVGAGRPITWSDLDPVS